MMLTLGRKNIGTVLNALVVSLWLGTASTPGLEADEAKDVAKRLLDLTGNRRVKVV